jgi:hypothetical protein
MTPQRRRRWRNCSAKPGWRSRTYASWPKESTPRSSPIEASSRPSNPAAGRFRCRSPSAPNPGSGRHASPTTSGGGAAYFAASEAIANALKHAGARRVTVLVAYDRGRLSVEVADDGVGFAQRDVPRRGLADLEDRLAALGGRLSIQSAPGTGTTVRCEFPAQPREPTGG